MKTTYKITTYTGGSNPQVLVLEQKKQPSLQLLQKLVGGLIEWVPTGYYQDSNKEWFNRQHPNVDAVWCDEEGLLKDLTANKFFTPAPWGDSLYGNVVVVERITNE